jgi:hypothetical protein
MATIQLRNLLGRTLNRTRFTGATGGLEPPERIEIDETATWTAEGSGSVTFLAASTSERAREERFTLAWEAAGQAQARYTARELHGRVRVRSQMSGGNGAYTVRRRRRLWPVPPRGRAARPVAVAALAAAVAVALLGVTVLARRGSGPTGIASATATATGMPSVTTSPLPPTARATGTATAQATATAKAGATATATATASATATATATNTPPPRSAALHVYTKQVTTPGEGMVTASIYCHGGQHLVGGGFDESANPVPPSPGKSVWASYPSSTSAWTVTAIGGATSGIVTMYAVCLQANFPITMVLVSNSHVIPVSSVGTTRAGCPAGSVLTGGGFNNPGALDLLGTYPQSNGWGAEAYNASGTTTPIGAFALCATENLSGAGVATTTVPAPPYTNATAVLTCGGNKLLAMGGDAWDASGNPPTYAGIVVSAATDLTASSWTFVLRDDDNSAHNVTLTAVCIAYA